MCEKCLYYEDGFCDNFGRLLDEENLPQKCPYYISAERGEDDGK